MMGLRRKPRLEQHMRSRGATHMYAVLCGSAVTWSGLLAREEMGLRAAHPSAQALPHSPSARGRGLGWRALAAARAQPPAREPQPAAVRRTAAPGIAYEGGAGAQREDDPSAQRCGHNSAAVSCEACSSRSAPQADLPGEGPGGAPASALPPPARKPDWVEAPSLLAQLQAGGLARAHGLKRPRGHSCSSRGSACFLLTCLL
jgi:hypothetical protein